MMHRPWSNSGRLPFNDDDDNVVDDDVDDDNDDWDVPKSRDVKFYSEFFIQRKSRPQ